ncbi:xylose isomerase-like protein [Talaromyces proteolyticus]|uniref:Xylose isomerase-like protein n=1 Tax=Talaromyces proteolyticus TaxID=1131652 RepID=A0AAD4KGT0_9EURO|nr:xylose isomerase-like protein [Talaromyces proteolyticus]KAH8689157.1 xylose isomerase-like protein [Talaromyces proteolyticus]
MHLSSHTWMRPEPLETTLKRLSSLGYTSIELEGEPNRFPIDETKQLLKKYNLKCWGAVTIMQGTRDLTAADSKHRQETVQYMKDVVALSAALGGEIATIVPARVGKLVPTSSPEQEWKWVVHGLREVAAFAKTKNIRVGIEPLNRFETYFLNRTDQTLALADEVGYDCGIAFDPFHLALEEKDMLEAMRKCGSRIIDFHAADNNRHAAGDGSFNWPEIMTVLKETGYKGALAVECIPPIDRSPVGNYSLNQVETDTGNIEVSPDRLEFIIDHGSALLSEEYYTYLMKRSAETLGPFTKD